MAGIEMSPGDMTRLLHESIPLSVAMGVQVAELSPTAAVLTAPQGLNINHQGTVFGGSLTSLALLSAYSVVLNQLRGQGYDHYRVVVRHHSFSYYRPACSDVTARAVLDTSAVKTLVEELESNGQGRLTIQVAVTDRPGHLVGRLEGVFVLLPPAPAPDPEREDG